MFTITHNIAAVRGRLTKLQVGVPKAMKRAVDPSLYESRLRSIATGIVHRLADGLGEAEVDAILGMLASISILSRQRGFVAHMGMAEDEGTAEKMEQYGKSSFVEKEEIRKWIDEYKDLTMEDYGPDGEVDYERITYRILNSMRKDPDQWFNSTDKTGLISQVLSSTGASPNASAALEEVFMAWSDYLHREVPSNALRELRAILNQS